MLVLQPATISDRELDSLEMMQALEAMRRVGRRLARRRRAPPPRGGVPIAPPPSLRPPPPPRRRTLDGRAAAP